MKKQSILYIILIGLISSLLYVFFTKEEHIIKKETQQVVIQNVIVNSQKEFLYPKQTIDQIVEHEIYAFSYNETHEQANWVAYKLFPHSVNNLVKRKDNFRKDLKVVSGSATVNDYKKSGYDRGHLAPAKAMSFSKETMSESFFMSNMSPQKPSFNRGVWKRLEEQVRKWIFISDSLYVVTGPILKDPLGFIGENKVTIPSAYYKSIIRFKKGKMIGLGFILKNKKSSKKLSEFSVSIDSIEKVTGIDFFEKLNLNKQNDVESNNDYQFFIKK